MQIPTPHGSLLARFLAIVLVLHSCLFLPVLASQTSKQKITMIASDVTLDNVFKQIESQTGLRFMFAVEALDVNEKVTVNFKKTILDEVLSALLKSKGIVWQYREGTISLKRQVVDSKLGSIEIEGVLVSDPLIVITGKILDAKGNPVPGATVIVKGTRRGTRTDGDGNFVLRGVEVNALLMISSVGFETKEIRASEVTMIVRMNEVIGRLDETVIVGYGTTTQRFNTGNVISIKAEDIAKQPISDPLLALQGRVPGMTITQTTGVQGGQVKVQIRGQNSILSTTTPLFIVDGVPYNSSIAALPGGRFGAIGNIISTLSFINPADIESIDILKDADATAIYGSRGANGVVLITTKKGKVGAAKVDMNVSSGWQNVIQKRSLLNIPQYLEMRREAFKNDGLTPSANPSDPGYAPDLMIWDTTRYTDWQKAMIGRTAHYTDAQASISGGTAAIQYLVGGNYHKETTIFPGDFSSQRGGGHFSIVGASTNQKLKTTLTQSYTVTKMNFPGGDFANNVNLSPNAPLAYNTDGSLNWANSTWVNPYAQLISNVLDAQTNNLITNVDVSYRLLPGLVLKTNLGYNELRNNTFRGQMIAGINPAFRSTATASATYTNAKTRSWIMEPQATYTLTIGKGFLNILMGATLLGNKADAQRLLASGIKDDAFIKYLSAASSFSSNGSGSNYKYAAFFGRVGYNMKDKYLLNVTVRRDGSSRFGPRKQFATFGSVGVGWIFSQEAFVRTVLPFLSYGKLRGSYGTTGNDGIGDYQYLDKYEFQTQPYQRAKGLKVVGIYNQDFAWELTRKTELGLETGFFKNRILLTASYYSNLSGNQLLASPLPAMTGGTSVTGNLSADIRNTGLELMFSTKNIQTRNFEWSTEFNITISRNKLLSYPKNIPIFAKEGRALTVKDLYKFISVDPITGRYLFANTEGKPVEATDASIAYNATSKDIAPAYFGGCQNSFRYKEFRLDIFFQYVNQQGQNGEFDPAWIPGTMRNQPVAALTRWRSEGDVAQLQRSNQNFQLFTDYNAWLSSDRAYGNASFIRCKNIAFSWQLPDIWKRKMHVINSRFYIQGQNLFTITRYPGWDPETQSVTVIPPLRVLTAGIQLTL